MQCLLQDLEQRGRRWDSLSAFAALLRQLLGKHGWTASDLARQLGVNRGTVNRWVNGETLPERGRMAQIADIFLLTGAERDALFRGWFDG